MPYGDERSEAHYHHLDICLCVFNKYGNIMRFALDFFLHSAIICTYFNDAYINSCYETNATHDALVVVLRSKV